MDKRKKSEHKYQQDRETQIMMTIISGNGWRETWADLEARD
jgi:hypothetical protein